METANAIAVCLISDVEGSRRGSSTTIEGQLFVKGLGCRPVRDGSEVAVGPAFESLQGRKPRDDEAPATLPRPMGISPDGEGLGEGLRRGSTVRRVC
jgi:hypothetical protein